MERSGVDLDDMLAFLRVVETGSFARAGNRLGVSKSIVSRRVARLEAQLGAALLTRSARGATPTEIGRAYRQRIAAIFGDLEAANEAVGAAASRVAGPIRMTAPISLGVNHVAPLVAAFAIANPQVEVDLVLEDRRTDLIAEQFDLAVRIGTLPDSSLIARRLGRFGAVAVASPAYLDERGRPAHPRDLSRHELLFYGNIDPGSEWRFRIGGRWQRLRVTSRMRVNNGDAMREMLLAGFGIAMLPSFIAAPAIADRSLEVVLPEWPLDEIGVHAVMPPGRAVLGRVRALVDHLAQGLAARDVEGFA